MLDQDFYADAEQDQPAQQFGLYLPVYGRAEADAETEAQHAHQERDEADDEKRRQQLRKCGIAGAGEADADRHGVDAGGDREGQLRFQSAGLQGGRRLLMKGLPDHFPADESEHPEGDPMVHRLDIMAETAGEDPADERHQCLEKAENKRQREHCARLPFPDDDPADHGNGEAVHGQRKR